MGEERTGIIKSVHCLGDCSQRISFTVWRSILMACQACKMLIGSPILLRDRLSQPFVYEAGR